MAWDMRLGITGWGKWPTGNCTRDEIWSYWLMVYAQTRICPRKLKHTKFYLTLRFKWITQSRPEDQTLINKKKKNMLSSEFCCSSRPKSKNKSKWLDRQILGSCLRAEKAVEHESDNDTNCRWCSWNSPQRPGKETGGTGDRGRIKTTEITVLLRLAGIFRRVLEIWGDLLLFRFQWKTTS